MAENNYQLFSELSDAVIAQLKEPHYMDSTLAGYAVTYRKGGKFMEQEGFRECSPDIGMAFIDA